jgi:chromosome partitioning protein
LSAPIIAFFNDRGGVGTTTLVYHLAWMFSDLGIRVLAADLDPQADLSAACRGQDRLEELLSAGRFPTIYNFVDESMKETAGAQPALAENLDVSLLPLVLGDLRLSQLDDLGQERSLELTAAFGKVFSEAADHCRAEVVLVDLAPNLGAINRAALLAADFLVVPLAADLLSMYGLRNLGPALREWKGKSGRVGNASPVGYVVQQNSVRFSRPIKSNQGWFTHIPAEFQGSVLGNPTEPGTSVKDDPWCLALLKHYHSLMPMAQEAQKPMFHLKVADGAIGAHFQAAQSVGQEYKRLAERIAERAGLKLPYLS